MFIHCPLKLISIISRQKRNYTVLYFVTLAVAFTLSACRFDFHQNIGRSLKIHAVKPSL